jgi:hypothetical protein
MRHEAQSACSDSPNNQGSSKGNHLPQGFAQSHLPPRQIRIANWHRWSAGLLRPEDHLRGHGLVGELAATEIPPPEAPSVPDTSTPNRFKPSQRLQVLATFFSMPLRRFLFEAPTTVNQSDLQCLAPSHHLAVLTHQAAFLHGTASRTLSCASPRRHLPERAHMPRQRFTDAMRKHERVRPLLPFFSVPLWGFSCVNYSSLNMSMLSSLPQATTSRCSHIQRRFCTALWA